MKYLWVWASDVMGTKGSEPMAHPPTASKTFSLGFIFFRAFVRSYNPETVCLDNAHVIYNYIDGMLKFAMH